MIFGNDHIFGIIVLDALKRKEFTIRSILRRNGVKDHFSLIVSRFCGALVSMLNFL